MKAQTLLGAVAAAALFPLVAVAQATPPSFSSISPQCVDPSGFSQCWSNATTTAQQCEYSRASIHSWPMATDTNLPLQVSVRSRSAQTPEHAPTRTTALAVTLTVLGTAFAMPTSHGLTVRCRAAGTRYIYPYSLNRPPSIGSASLTLSVVGNGI